MGEGLRWESDCSEISQHSPDNYRVVLTPGLADDCGSQGGKRVEWPTGPTFQRKLEAVVPLQPIRALNAVELSDYEVLEENAHVSSDV